MVRVALVASLLGAAEGGFRMTGYRSLGCLSTSMGWGDSEISVLTLGDDECLEVQGGWFLVYYEWSMKLECLADCDADVSYSRTRRSLRRRAVAGPAAAPRGQGDAGAEPRGDDDDDDGDLSRAAAAVIAGAAALASRRRRAAFLAQVALFIVGCAAIASVYARRALPHDDATFDTLPTGGAPAPPPVPVAVPAPRPAELESSTRLQSYRRGLAAGPSPRSSADRPAWHPVVEGL
ncbi:hypothetical protein JL720_17339 [Aureococcus anophagefferens]|nr:hypothetical protein JL720_17339 [Aureococcus anophagefferens]